MNRDVNDTENADPFGQTEPREKHAQEFLDNPRRQCFLRDARIDFG